MDQMNQENRNPGYYYSNHSYYYVRSGGRTKYPDAEPYPARRREMIFLALALLCGMVLVNFTLFGGFHLGFSIGAILCVGCSVGYLISMGHRLTGYSATLLALALILAAGFARSDDETAKFAAFAAFGICYSLGACLLAGRNCFPVGAFGTVLDGPQCLLGWGFGDMAPALGGVKRRMKSGSGAVRKGGAIAAGLCVAIPVMCLLVGLLMSADAAFDALIQRLPQISFGQILVTLVLGCAVASVFYTWGAALQYHPKRPEPVVFSSANLNPLTVNTVLMAVCVVYVVYLFSQLAYFVGGFSGILPEEFTMAEYARRGFFEMGLLCAVNLTITALAVGLVEKREDKAPRSSRILCLFIGLMTVFFVVAASAKMGRYIQSYGLTRLRVLTEVVTVFLGLVTVIVCLWLFVPKLPYMQWVLVLALVFSAGVLWSDVDAVVARYNVSAYQSGQLKKIDMNHMMTLGYGSVPYVELLTEDDDAHVSEMARDILENTHAELRDFRRWNYARWRAGRVTKNNTMRESDFG